MLLLMSHVMLLLMSHDVTDHRHGNSEVRPQLIVSPGLRCPECILVDEALIGHGFYAVGRNEEIGFKVQLDTLSPLVVGDWHPITFS